MPVSKKTYTPFSSVDDISDIERYLDSQLVFVSENIFHCPDKPADKDSCYRGGILRELHDYAFNHFKTKLTDEFVTGDLSGILEDMKASGEVTVRQYLFAVGLAASHEQMLKTTREVSHDEPAKTMFTHLVDLIKPTCTDVRLDLTGPGSIKQQNASDEYTLTGKLEIAYSFYRASYNYSLTLVIEMKSNTLSQADDSTNPQELQLLAEMAYCLKTSRRTYVIGLLFAKGFVTCFIMHQQPGKTYWTKLKLNGKIVNEFFSIGHEIEQLIYHSLHSTLDIQLIANCIELTTRWKTCCLWEPLYVKDRTVTADD